MAAIFSSTQFVSSLFKRCKSKSSLAHSSPEEIAEALTGIDIHRPLLKGKIFKHASDGTKFNKRYFVLYPMILLYYEHERNYFEDLALGKISKCTLFKLDELHLSLVAADQQPPGAKFCFKLHIPHSSNPRNELLLAFSSRKNKRKWMAYLQSQNPDLLDPED